MRRKPSGFQDATTRGFAGRFAPITGFMGGSETAPTTTTLTAPITDGTDPIIGGQNEVYTVQVTNTGAADATSISVTITLDASLTWVSQSGTGWTLNHTGQVVTATLATLAPGAANPITVTATAANATASITTTADTTCANATTVNSSAVTTVDAVTRDATSGIYYPSSSTEWTKFRAYFGLSAPAPDSLWLLQEASGNAADSIGAFTLTATGTVSYQQALAGHTRKGVGTTDNVSSHFTTTSGSLPLGGAASQMTMLVANIPATPAGNRSLYNGQTGTTIRINSTPRVVAISGANTSTGASSPTATTRPYVYRENFTAATSTVMTDQEKLVPTHGTISGRNLSLGSSSAACAAVIGYACAWYSANAEISDANVKALLQAMGFTIPW